MNTDKFLHFGCKKLKISAPNNPAAPANEFRLQVNLYTVIKHRTTKW